MGNIKSNWESNAEALIHPRTGLAAVIKEIIQQTQPVKDKFLNGLGLNIKSYRKLNKKGKDLIQKQWIESEEFKQLSQAK